jgi:hypothetical protein
VPKPDKTDYIDWDAGREGYIPSKPRYIPVVEIPKSAPKKDRERHLLSIRAQERLASSIAAGGTIWAVYVATFDYNNLWRMHIMPPGPVEVCALGILAWLHAKWRRSIKAG